MVNPSIMIHENIESPMNKLYNDQRLGLTRDKSEATLQILSSE